jgi:hypothetical protein
MNVSRKQEVVNAALALAVFVGCTYVLAALIGFRYGYDAALKVELRDYGSIEVAVHGTSLIEPIVSGIVLCWVFSLLYIYVVIRGSASNAMRLLLLAGATLAITYTLYYKYVVYTLTGSPGFLNAYEQIFRHLTAIELLSFSLLTVLMAIESWKLITTKK